MRVCLVAGEPDPIDALEMASGVGSDSARATAGRGRWATLAAGEFARRGHETHVLSFDPEYCRGLPGSVEGERAGVRVHRLDWADPVVALPGYDSRAMQHAMGVQRTLAALHAKLGFDLIVFSSLGGEGALALAARRWGWGGAGPEPLAGAVCVVRETGRMMLAAESLREWRVTRALATCAAMERSAVEMADAVVEPRAGETTAEEVTRLLGLLGNARTEEARTGSPRRDGSERGSASAGATRVSVIVPVFNMHRYLRGTLESVARQTVPPLEVIVVDDGSTDPGAIALIRELEASGVPGLGSLRVHRQKNGGLSAARNSGVALAQGDWIVPLDSDDELEPGFLEACARAATRDPKLNVVATGAWFVEEDETTPSSLWCPVGFDVDSLGVFNAASCCTAMIRRSALEAVGGYDPTLSAYEDWDVWCALARLGGRASCATIPDPLVRVRIRQGSMLRSMTIAEHERLRARLIAKHFGSGGLSPRADIALRLLQSDDAMRRGASADGLAHVGLGPLPMRYRLADQANELLKRAGVQRVIKRLAGA
ncbi:MAG: glycosyltransferase family A protein [Planctomycetota bacterium]|nr:glycosyltransferase family A protein [Planctomycetota bacterium]